MTIKEFLEARIAEDEARASSGWSRLGNARWETTNEGQDILTPSAVLAECAAKRAIIEDWEDPAGQWLGASDVDAGHILATDYAVRALAAIYADHPAYQQEWALRVSD